MYCIYLRKSRADLEAEQRGEGETLARHRRALLDLAAARQLPIGKIYEEIVSGDTISDRPQMQLLLHDVEQHAWQGVLTMDIDRLGRGDSIDQGIIMKTFKYSSTKIITPYKTFDPTQEMDEEYFEYNQYMARGEYKRIKRRMWAGRVASAQEGKYQSPKPPFGYSRVKLQGEKGWSLSPVADQAEAVRMAFRLYLHGENGDTVGMDIIAQRLNAMGFRTFTGKTFKRSEVRTMLSNPVYIGKIRWNQRRKTTSMKDGQEVTTRPRSAECFVVDGRHPAIVDTDTFDAVQAKLKSHPSHKKSEAPTMNPFAGLMYCAECGKAIIRTPLYGRNAADALRCHTPGCPTSGVDLPLAEGVVLNVMHEWLDLASRPDHSPASVPCTESTTAIRQGLEKQLATLSSQQERLCDLLEQGIYDTDTFLSRNKTLSARIAAIKESLSALSTPAVPTTEEAIRALKPQLQHLLDAWPSSTPAEKNALLRTVVSRIVYSKPRRCYRNEDPTKYLSLDVVPLFKNH